MSGMTATSVTGPTGGITAPVAPAAGQAQASGIPFLVRGPLTEEGETRYHETVFLPLGANDGAVDHLLVVGVQVPEPFWQYIDNDPQKLAQDAGLTPVR